MLCGYLERDNTVTGAYYANLIRKVRPTLQEKRWGKLSREVFHQDNAPAHTSSQALAAITNCRFKLLSHYHIRQIESRLPSDFCLFPNLKEFLRK